MAISGFEVLALAGVAEPTGWTLTGVSFGSATNWGLIATFERGANRVAIRFENPASVRITDEGDLLSVWSSLWSELSTGGLVYKVRQSDFLDWFNTSSSGLHGEVSHYLLAGADTCVEVISSAAPTAETDLDPASAAQLRAIGAVDALAQCCAELRDAAPKARVVLDDIVNTLMTELWDRSFTQTEIRKGFEGAVADMNRYAAGEERRR